MTDSTTDFAQWIGRREITEDDLGLAPAEPLMLMEVAYDFDFVQDDGALGLAVRSLQKKRREDIGTMVMASYLLPLTGTSPSAARRPSNRPR